MLIGSWERGQLHGTGRMLGGRGEAYEGDFCNGLRDGEGECVYCDGGVYRGQWAAGLCEGHGRLQQADAYYDGGWHRGEMAGSGTRRYEIHHNPLPPGHSRSHHYPSPPHPPAHTLTRTHTTAATNTHQTH